MIRFLIVLTLLVSFLLTSLKSVELVNTKSLNLDFYSNINFYTKNIQQKNYQNTRKDLDSNVSFVFKTPLEANAFGDNFIIAVLDLGIKNDLLNNQSTALYNKYSYIQLENSSFGLLSAGIIPSIINQYAISNVNKTNINLLDAGYLYNSLYYNADAYNTFVAEKAVSYVSKYTNWLVAVQYSSSNDKEKADNLTTLDILDVKLNYSLATLIKYFNDDLSVSFAYQRNHILYNQSKDYLANSSFKNNNFLATFNASYEKLYVASTIGYYNNLHLIGINYIGFATYLEYKLTKVVPYIGYNLLILQSYTNSFFKNLYNQNSSVDFSNIIIGLKYNINNNALLGFEYRYDLRAKNIAKNSLLQNKKNNSGNIYFKLSF